MAIGKAPAGRTRKSKSEVQAEFEKIENQVQAQKVEHDSRAEDAAKIREAEIRESVAEISVEAVVQKIGGLGVEISKYLSDVSSRLMTGANLLSSLREAVALEKRELDRLHKIDISKTAIDLLVDDYNHKKATSEKEEEETRTLWQEEREARDREEKEFDDSLKKQRTREREEYEYQKASERKKEEAEYEEGLRIQERKNKEKQEALEKNWALREAFLKEKEEEFARFKKENAEFPEQLRSEVEKAIQETLAAEKGKQEQSSLLLQKEFETERRVAELRIKGLEDTVARQYAQIESLGDRLDEAKKQVQDIAVKAIEGASGARALSHVNQIAMEQAKPRPPM